MKKTRRKNVTPDPRSPSGAEAKKNEAQAQPRSAESPRKGDAGAPLVVGVGASAGGLEPLQDLVGATPRDASIVVVIVTHLSKDAVSVLPSILAKRTECSVVELEGDTKIVPGSIYLPPPGSVVTLEGDVLRLGEEPRDGHPIDAFFISLAEARCEDAVGVLLSGSGSDGTRGSKEIKAAGGLVFTQEAAGAQYQEMILSALNSHCVDAELAPEKIPAAIVAAVSRRMEGEPARDDDPVALQRILGTLRTRTGHDFGAYKKSTLLRRIGRRMSIGGLLTMRDYARMVEETPGEAHLLFQEILIGVTSFFRDEEAFDAFRVALRSRIEGQVDDDRPIRIWACACATGEEAYSLAIVARELVTETGKSMPVQVFATDLDPHAIDVARAGRYPLTIASQVSTARLERFFTKDEREYRIDKEIRESVVFAAQNVIKDPPFTKLDAISCRNLLIYLEPDLQRRVLGLFSYALKPGGILFLGSSESIGTFDEAYENVEKKHKVFRRRTTPGAPLSDFPEVSRDTAHRALPGRALVSRSEAPLAQAAERVFLNELVPPSVIVNERGDIAYFHGRTGPFLEPPSGEPVANLFAMAREGLRLELPAAIRQAATRDLVVVRPGLTVKHDGGALPVRLRVRKIVEPGLTQGSFLVSFEREELEAEKKSGTSGAPPPRLAQLELELQHTRENLQGTIEQLETSNEELKSTNEELQSTNEELQSANEELETSREEMQSLNEELQTVNSELEERNRALSQANDDMQNLLNSTDIATVFLDRELSIKRFTTQACRVFSLIETDIGRPISDLTANLRYDGLMEEAREVLATLVFREREIQTKEGSWRLMRIMPYRTAENVIDGLVMTFVDIDHVKREEKAAEEARSFSDEIMNAMPVGMAVLDAELRVVRANQHLLGLLRTTANRILGEKIGSAVYGAWDGPDVEAQLQAALASGPDPHEIRVKRIRPEERAATLTIRRFSTAAGAVHTLLVVNDAPAES